MTPIFDSYRSRCARARARRVLNPVVVVTSFLAGCASKADAPLDTVLSSPDASVPSTPKGDADASLPPSTKDAAVDAPALPQGPANACDVARGPVKSGKLAFASGKAEYDALYAKAVDVIAKDTVNGAFIAGQNWSQVWTRDSSYSIDLGAGLLETDVATATLKGMTEHDNGAGGGGRAVWIQDAAGHFGGWPNLSDSIVGAQGAWSLYLITGNHEFLAWAYDVTVATLARAERDVFQTKAGLFGGCSSFMESDSGYPSKYRDTKTLLAKTKALSTNLLYYRGYDVAAKMGRLLGKDVSTHQAKADALKAAINARLWIESAGYYGYFEDENGAVQRTMEGTGESFAILWGVADEAKTKRILSSVYESPWGVPCLWPQYPEWRDYGAGFPYYYHNGMVWPFVQGYWGWAAAAGGSVDRFGTELEKMRAVAAKNSTIQEFYRVEDGAPDGSPRQLWSASGVLSMVYHGLIGMSFDDEGITFAPAVPDTLRAITLDGVAYRGATLNISVTGSGNTIARFRVDGTEQPNPRISSALTGTHSISIALGECHP